MRRLRETVQRGGEPAYGTETFAHRRSTRLTPERSWGPHTPQFIMGSRSCNARLHVKSSCVDPPGLAGRHLNRKAAITGGRLDVRCPRVEARCAWRSSRAFSDRSHLHRGMPKRSQASLPGSGRDETRQPGASRPTDSEQRCENASCRGAAPLAHAAAKDTLSNGDASPFSRRSASTRKARACALACASSTDCPYTSTPGSSATSAIHRPSSSRSTSTLKFMIEAYLTAR